MANYLCKKFPCAIPVSHSTSVTDRETDGRTDDNHDNT